MAAHQFLLNGRVSAQCWRPAMPDPDRVTRRQQVLADFGEFSLRSENLDEVLAEACRLVGEALGTGRAKVLEIQQGGECLFVRAGVGWVPGVVGQMRLPMAERSSETRSEEHTSELH